MFVQQMKMHGLMLGCMTNDERQDHCDQQVIPEVDLGPYR